MSQDVLELVKLRNNFYRDSYRKVLIALLLSILTIGGLVLTIAYLIVSKPTPKYFAATNSGRIIPLIPLNQPNLSDSDLIQWASRAVIAVNSYNYVNFRQAFQSNRKYFTAGGWRGFLKALEDSKTIETIQNNKLMVSAVLSGAPVVTNQYQDSGRYIWKLQMPILVTYQGSDVSNQSFMVTLKVQRISTLDNVYGVGISEFVMGRNN